MQKNIKQLVIFLMLIAVLPAKAYTERNILTHSISREALAQALVQKRAWVTYPSYSDRAGWDKLFGTSKQAAISKGEKYLNYEWKVVKAMDYLAYSKTGDRGVMENPNKENNSAISALFMAELAEGKGRFIPQLINGVFFTCEKASWVLSAHLSSLQTTHSPLPELNETIIDLGSGEVSGMMSWIYYFFHNEFDKVNKTIAKRMKHEIEQKTLIPFIENNSLWWMARNYKQGRILNNWTPWCNFNVLQSYLLIEDDPQKLANAVYLTMESVDKYLNYVQEDGACEEGPSYWGSAPGKLYDYLEILKIATGGKVDVFNNPMIKNMGEYIVRNYVGNGWVVNFADASAKANLTFAPVIYRYGKAINSLMMMDFAGYLDKQSKYTEEQGRYLMTGTDAYRMLTNLQVKDELKARPGTFKHPPYTWYPGSEVCYMNNKAGMFFAAKGGNNNESHNHNDVGTFSLYVDATPVFIDAGVGTYTKKTFSEDRYDIWTMQSNYHNLPLINGIAENEGAKYKATDTSFDPKTMTFSMNIASAFPKSAMVTQYKRSYNLQKDRLIINDSYELQEAKVPNQMNFLTWGTADISQPGKIIVNVNNVALTLVYDVSMWEIKQEKVKLDDIKLTDVWGNSINRITLTAKSTTTTGKYQFVITRSK